MLWSLLQEVRSCGQRIVGVKLGCGCRLLGGLVLGSKSDVGAYRQFVTGERTE